MERPTAPRVTLVGFIEEATPCELSAVSLTIPMNPFIGVTATVEAPKTPTLRGPTVGGLALTMKSGRGLTMTTRTVEWVRPPLPAVTIMLNEPSI